MYTVLTLYKKNTNVMDELFLGPVEPVLMCFSTNHEINGKYGISFLADVQAYVSKTGEYGEVHMEFINEDKYQEWHDTFGDSHDPARAELDAYLRSQGITVQRYFETTDLADPSGTKPISEFVPRNEMLNVFVKPIEI